MSTYSFTLRNYHAVKEADIEIAGLSVIGGVNGCGKSTIARWLNYVVNVLNNYDRYVITLAWAAYEDLAVILSRAVNIDSTLRQEWIKGNSRINRSDTLEEMNDSFKALAARFADLLLTHSTPQVWEVNRRRLSSLFDLEEYDDEPLHLFINRIEDYLMAEGNKVYQTAEAMLENHTFDNWKGILFDRVDLSIDDTDIDFQLAEDGVELLRKNNFSVPLMLRNAVYINTQEISAAIGASSQDSGNLLYQLQNKSDSSTPKSRLLAKMIRKIIDGDVVIDNHTSKFFGRGDRLHYVRENGPDILLRGAATGIISFSILLQLLENGWITENTLLIIDEPEAHLHPQWIVEYARILVKINKIIGAKVVVSTHNPDMLAALQAIAESEEILPRTIFYLAEKSAESDRYVYRNLGQNIGPIFDSFNIALDRIELYGPSPSNDQ